MSRVKTSFALHSETNRRLYPASRYPLTHCIDRQNVAKQCLEHSMFLPRAIHSFLWSLASALIVCAIFRSHVYLYNEFFGPFHVDREALAVHVKNYDQHFRWALRKEYFQVELGAGNIQNPASHYETIRRYSDPKTRRDHIATFKTVDIPSIYVKLPSRSTKYFHRRFPFDFRLFTTSTIRCVFQQLPLNPTATIYRRWLNKSEYVPFINEEYARNITRFNSLVLSKCGILVGYLYRPEHELAFLPTRSYHFDSDDMALDVTSEGSPFWSLFIQSFLPTALLLRGIYYLSIYLSVLVRVRYLHVRGIFPFPLGFSADIVRELRLPTSDAAPEQYLLQLDSYVGRSEHRFQNQIFLIMNDSQYCFVIFLRAKLNELVNDLHSDEVPFEMCPAADIQRIDPHQGICYGRDSSWMPWPREIVDSSQNYSEWLQQALIQTSVHYRLQ